MKLFVILLAVVATVALADSNQLGHLGQAFVPAGPATDDVMCSQPFDFATLQNGLGCNSANSWMIADDVTNTTGEMLDMVEVWMIFTGSGASQYNFTLFEAAMDAPGSTVFWSGSETSITNTDTGLTNWGYAIWNSVCQFAAPVEVTASVTYWFALQTESSTTDYFLCTDQKWADETYFSTDNGGSWVSSTTEFGAAYEQFMILNTVDALDRCTWGEIKAVF